MMQPIEPFDGLLFIAINLVGLATLVWRHAALAHGAPASSPALRATPTTLKAAEDSGAPGGEHE